ncbi:MAG: hypothetical protein IPO21_10985 [Bacteroidales bacterium]|nr:hypothetical protein [Bacteroidales bacterium]
MKQVLISNRSKFKWLKANVFTIIIFNLLFLSSLKAQECIDSSKIDTSSACNTLYDPVCGCNKVSYSNSCEAEKNGIINYSKGKCNVILSSMYQEYGDVMFVGQFSKIESYFEGIVINWDDFLVTFSDTSLMKYMGEGVVFSKNEGTCTLKVTDRITGQSISFEYYNFKSKTYINITADPVSSEYGANPPYTIKVDYSEDLPCCNTYNLVPTRVGNTFSFSVEGSKTSCPDEGLCYNDLSYTISDLEEGEYTIKMGDFDTIIKFTAYPSLVYLMKFPRNSYWVGEYIYISVPGLNFIDWSNYIVTNSNPSVLKLIEENFLNPYYKTINFGKSTITITDKLTHDSHSFDINVIMNETNKPKAKYSFYENKIDINFTYYACGEKKPSYSIKDSTIYVTTEFIPYTSAEPCDIGMNGPAVAYLTIDSLKYNSYHVIFKSDTTYSVDTILVKSAPSILHTLYIKNTLKIGETDSIVSNMNYFIDWNRYELTAFGDFGISGTSSQGTITAFGEGTEYLVVTDLVTGDTVTFRIVIKDYLTPFFDLDQLYYNNSYSLKIKYTEYFDCNIPSIEVSEIKNDTIFFHLNTPKCGDSKCACPNDSVSLKTISYWVSGLAEGTYTITDGEVYQTITLEPSRFVDNIYFKYDELPVGYQTELLIDADKDVNWDNFTISSIDESILTVSNNIVTAVNTGYGRLIIMDNFTSEITFINLEVIPTIELNSLDTLNQLGIEISYFGMFDCNAPSIKVSEITENTILFHLDASNCSAENCVCPDNSKYLQRITTVVNNLSEGTYTVSDGIDSAVIDLEFSNILNDLYLTKSLINVGETANIDAQHYSQINWSDYYIYSSDNTVVTVDEVGKVTGVGAGYAFIQIININAGKEVSFFITVEDSFEPIIEVTNITLDSSDYKPKAIKIAYTNKFNSCKTHRLIQNVSKNTIYLGVLSSDTACETPDTSLQTLTTIVEGLETGVYTVTDGIISQTIKVGPESFIYKMKIKDWIIPVGAQTKVMVDSLEGFNWDNFTITSSDESIATVNKNIITCVNEGYAFFEIVDNETKEAINLDLLIEPVLKIYLVDPNNPYEIEVDTIAIEIAYFGLFDCNLPTIEISEITDNRIIYNVVSPKCGDEKCFCIDETLEYSTINAKVEGLSAGTYTVTNGRDSGVIILRNTSYINDMYVSKSQISYGEFADIKIDNFISLKWDKYIVKSTDESVVQCISEHFWGVGIGQAEITIEDIETNEIVRFPITVVEAFDPEIEITNIPLTTSAYKPNAINIALTHYFDCCNTHSLTQYVSNDTIYIGFLSTEMACETPDTCLQTLTTTVEGLDYGTYVINVNNSLTIKHTIRESINLFFLEKV